MIEVDLTSLSLDPIQLVAVSLISMVFLLALLGMGRSYGFLAQFAAMAPNTLTSLGIFFTFVGILISLSNFDIDAINDSIPRLLDGLKLAFLSSVVGLGFSVLFRLLQAGSNRNQSAGEIGAAELNDQLRELNNNTLAVRDALIGDGDASLSTQFGKLRNDFRDFADKMKEDGTQALVKALEEVIKDFNQKISEQFGENFKQLNEAVAALLEWQQEYKIQVEQLTRAFKETQTGIASVEQTTAKIPAHMQSVESAFNATETRVEQLYKGIGSLAEMRDSAEQAVPELRQSIDTMTAGMRESIDSQLDVLRSQISETRDLTANLGDVVKTSLDQTEQNFAKQMEKFQGVLDSLNLGADNVLSSTESVAQKVKEIVDDFSSRQEKVARDVQSRIDQSVADNVEAMNQGLQDLDQGMQQQLQRAIDKMGNNLTSITETFVNTYEENARQIVELTRSLNR
jgi:methyl-accepting chemotaxis protein